MDVISRQAAIDELHYRFDDTAESWKEMCDLVIDALKDLPSAQPEGWVKIPDTGIDDLSDGFHTFRQLYYQRMMLFATIVRQNREKAWKSLRHEDGELCFGGGWFIVGIDTPEGSYTYHYEDNFYSLFDCKELECAKHWDGHTEKDVTRLLSLPSAQLYTEAEIQNMQDLEQAELAKAFELGKQDAQTEITRCKDCIYFDRYVDGIEKYQWDGFCADWARNTYEDWFCSRAERKGEREANYCPNCGSYNGGEK